MSVIAFHWKCATHNLKLSPAPVSILPSFPPRVLCIISSIGPCIRSHVDISLYTVYLYIFTRGHIIITFYKNEVRGLCSLLASLHAIL